MPLDQYPTTTCSNFHNIGYKPLLTANAFTKTFKEPSETNEFLAVRMFNTYGVIRIENSKGWFTISKSM